MSEKDSSGVRDYFLDGIINPNIYMKPEVHKSAEDREVVENRRNACYFCCKGGEELLNDEGKKLMKCSGCGDACYCSKTCQRSHWKDHKKFCGRVQKMQNTSGKEKLVNFHNENDDGIFKIFTSMFGSTKNTACSTNQCKTMK